MNENKSFASFKGAPPPIWLVKLLNWILPIAGLLFRGLAYPIPIFRLMAWLFFRG